MKYKFNAYGYPNIQATHKTTLEFTKDKEVSLRGDCIVGIKADFELGKTKKFVENSIKNNNKKITIKIKLTSKNKKYQETINAELNPNFNSNKEFVVRRTDFTSERTFAINSNKAAFELNRKLIDYLKEKENRIAIIISNKP